MCVCVCVYACVCLLIIEYSCAWGGCLTQASQVGVDGSPADAEFSIHGLAGANRLHSVRCRVRGAGALLELAAPLQFSNQFIFPLGHAIRTPTY